MAPSHYLNRCWLIINVFCVINMRLIWRSGTCRSAGFQTSVYWLRYRAPEQQSQKWPLGDLPYSPSSAWLKSVCGNKSLIHADLNYITTNATPGRNHLRALSYYCLSVRGIHGLSALKGCHTNLWGLFNSLWCSDTVWFRIS